MKHLLTLVALSAAHAVNGANMRAEPKTPEGIRIYQKVGNNVEVGIAHPSDITLAAGVAESVGSAARAHLSKMSDQGMTGSSHSVAATGPVDTFNYQGFADRVDSASEKALDQVGDVTHQAVQAARKQVLTEAGLTTGGTGAATGGETGSATGGEEMEATGTEASSGAEAEAEEAAPTGVGEESVEEETGGATGSTGNEAESLVDELRKDEGAKSATGLETDGATGAEPDNNSPTGSEDDSTTGSTGGTGGTGGTGATGATAGGDGHWQWIKKAHSGSTVKRHSDLLSTQ
jgi:hypothetical protein